MQILIDADACPVKEEACRVAKRHELQVILVSNSRMRVPEGSHVRLEVVGNGFDEADDWIVNQAGRNDIVITADILLAERCLKQGAFVLGPTGKAFTEDNIGAAVAAREIFSELREMGEMKGGPRPFEKKDRGEFLNQLDAAIHRLRRKSSLR